jgi:hypothetical protein
MTCSVNGSGSCPTAVVRITAGESSGSATMMECVYAISLKEKKSALLNAGTVI